MPIIIKQPTQIRAAGNKPKIIKEYIGRVNSNSPELSIAHMHSPSGWIEPPQTPEFNEYTLVLKGTLTVKTKESVVDLQAGQAIIILLSSSLIMERRFLEYSDETEPVLTVPLLMRKSVKDEWVQYSSPSSEGAEYIAVCLPAFSPETVHRES